MDAQAMIRAGSWPPSAVQTSRRGPRRQRGGAGAERRARAQSATFVGLAAAITARAFSMR